LVDAQGGPMTGKGVVPGRWQNQRLGGPFSLANDMFDAKSVSI